MLVGEAPNEGQGQLAINSRLGADAAPLLFLSSFLSSLAFISEAQPVHSCASKSINMALMKTPLDLSKDIDEWSSIVFIFSLREEMKAVSAWGCWCHAQCWQSRAQGPHHPNLGHIPQFSVPFFATGKKAIASAGLRGEIPGRYLTFKSLSCCQ